MGKRLSKIVTKTGDSGTTGLSCGARVAKYSPKIQAIGCIDELNSFVGLFIAYLNDRDEFADIADLYLKIQHHLFDMGGELSMAECDIISLKHIEFLENNIESLNKDLPPLEDFILPGGSKILGYCHVVRSITRRAERILAELATTEEINSNSLIYLNRLSDLAFVTARYLASVGGEKEILWQAGKVF